MVWYEYGADDEIELYFYATKTVEFALKDSMRGAECQ